MVVPIVERLKAHAKGCVSDPEHPKGSSARFQRLSLLMYSFIKLRGHKTTGSFDHTHRMTIISPRTVRFFPHEIADLTIALEYILMPDSILREVQQWAFRYVVLLWLALICMIPFDLAQFDEDGSSGSTASSIESVGKEFLGKAGMERDGAAILLSRLYMRQVNHAL
jgi:hypothetical protein